MRTATLVLLSSLAVGCDDIGDDGINVDTDGIPDDSDDDNITTAWNANLTGVGPYSTISGSSTVRQIINQGVFTAQITLRGDFPAGALRPWHVHVGSCGTGGAIVGNPASYPTLIVGGDGFAQADARVDFQLDPAAPYHVNVHVDPSDLPTLIACGNLVLQ